MQRVTANDAFVVCDGCGTEFESAHAYDPKRPVPQDIYLPESFSVVGEFEYCEKCAKALAERTETELAELRGEVVLGGEV